MNRLFKIIVMINTLQLIVSVRSLAQQDSYLHAHASVGHAEASVSRFQAAIERKESKSINKHRVISNVALIETYL